MNGNNNKITAQGGEAAGLRGGGREPTGLAPAAEAAWKIPLRAALKHNSQSLLQVLAGVGDGR